MLQVELVSDRVLIIQNRSLISGLSAILRCSRATLIAIGSVLSVRPGRSVLASKFPVSQLFSTGFQMFVPCTSGAARKSFTLPAAASGCPGKCHGSAAGVWRETQRETRAAAAAVAGRFGLQGTGFMGRKCHSILKEVLSGQHIVAEKKQCCVCTSLSVT